MKNKILSLIAVSLFSLNVNAAIHPSNSPSILIDSLSTPNVTVKKDTNSINMNKKISFDIRIYSTVTDFARFLGLSISQPLSRAT